MCKGYSSDVSDAEWAILEPFLQSKQTSGVRKYPLREVWNAILYVQRNGCKWEDLPHDFPPYEAVYITKYRWEKSGKIAEIHDQIVRLTRRAAGRVAEPTACIIDSQSVQCTEKRGSEDTTQEKRSKVVKGNSASTSKEISSTQQ